MDKIIETLRKDIVTIKCSLFEMIGGDKTIE